MCWCYHCALHESDKYIDTINDRRACVATSFRYDCKHAFLLTRLKARARAFAGDAARPVCVLCAPGNSRHLESTRIKHKSYARGCLSASATVYSLFPLISPYLGGGDLWALITCLACPILNQSILRTFCFYYYYHVIWLPLRLSRFIAYTCLTNISLFKISANKNIIAIETVIEMESVRAYFTTFERVLATAVRKDIKLHKAQSSIDHVGWHSLSTRFLHDFCMTADSSH